MALWIYPAKWVHDHKFFILNFQVKLLHLNVKGSLNVERKGNKKAWKITGSMQMTRSVESGEIRPEVIKGHWN